MNVFHYYGYSMDKLDSQARNVSFARFMTDVEWIQFQEELLFYDGGGGDT